MEYLLKMTNKMYDYYPLPVGGKGRYKHWQNIVNKFIPNITYQTVLDAGCGTGTITKILIEKNANVYACDISPNSIKVALQYAPNAYYKISDVLDLDYKNNMFDTCVCIGVLHHTLDPYKGFTELVRVTKPSGQILLFIYNKHHPYYIIYNVVNRLLKNKNIDDIPKPVIKMFGYLVGLFYNEDISYKDSKYWFCDIFLSPIVKFYTLKELRKWARLKDCKVKKVGYTLLRMNRIILMQKVGK